MQSTFKSVVVTHSAIKNLKLCIPGSKLWHNYYLIYFYSTFILLLFYLQEHLTESLSNLSTEEAIQVSIWWIASSPLAQTRNWGLLLQMLWTFLSWNSELAQIRNMGRGSLYHQWACLIITVGREISWDWKEWKQL